MESRKINKITSQLPCDVHKGEKIRYICRNDQCKHQLLFCGDCIVSQHQQHLKNKQVIEIKDFHEKQLQKLAELDPFFQKTEQCIKDIDSTCLDIELKCIQIQHQFITNVNRFKFQIVSYVREKQEEIKFKLLQKSKFENALQKYFQSQNDQNNPLFIQNVHKLFTLSEDLSNVDEFQAKNNMILDNINYKKNLIILQMYEFQDKLIESLKQQEQEILQILQNVESEGVTKILEKQKDIEIEIDQEINNKVLPEQQTSESNSEEDEDEDDQFSFKNSIINESDDNENSTQLQDGFQKNITLENILKNQLTSNSQELIIPQIMAIEKSNVKHEQDEKKIVKLEHQESEIDPKKLLIQKIKQEYNSHKEQVLPSIEILQNFMKSSSLSQNNQNNSQISNSNQNYVVPLIFQNQIQSNLIQQKNESTDQDQKQKSITIKDQPQTQSPTKIHQQQNSQNINEQQIQIKLQSLIFENETKFPHLLSAGIQAISYSNDDQYIAVNNGKIINLIDTQSLKIVQTLKGHSNVISSLCFNDANTQLISCSLDKSIKIWDLNNFRCVQSLENAHTKGINSLALNQNILISGGSDGYLKIWNFQFQCIKQLYEMHQNFKLVRISADNKLFITASDQQVQIRNIKIWDINTYLCLHQIESTLNLISSQCAFSFSHDSQNVVIAGPNEAITIIETQGFKTQKIINTQIKSDVNVVLFVSNTNQIIAANQTGKVILIDFESEQHQIISDNQSFIQAMAINHYHNQIILANRENTLHKLDFNQQIVDQDEKKI